MRCEKCENNYDRDETIFYVTTDRKVICDNCFNELFECPECGVDYSSEQEKFSLKDGMCKACAQQLL
jgi:primosomal protein N'